MFDQMARMGMCDLFVCNELTVGWSVQHGSRQNESSCHTKQQNERYCSSGCCKGPTNIKQHLQTTYKFCACFCCRAYPSLNLRIEVDKEHHQAHVNMPGLRYDDIDYTGTIPMWRVFFFCSAQLQQFEDPESDIFSVHAGLFWCLHCPPSSDIDYWILNVHICDLLACVYPQETSVYSPV